MRISILEKENRRPTHLNAVRSIFSVDPQSTQLSERAEKKREKGSGVEREGNVGKFIL